jgi:hypothetical protein
MARRSHQGRAGHEAERTVERLMAEMIPVDSDAIEEVGFDAGELFVKYRNGSTYVYFVVPEGVFHAFMGADSMGAFLNREIKPYYESRKL